MNSLADEKYIALTTFKRSGEAVTSPVWIVPVSDGRYAFWTSMGSGKTKRIKNNPTVRVQASNGTGKVKAGTTPVDGSAELVQSGPLFDEVHRAIRAKYGFMTTLSKIVGGIPMKRKGLAYADTVVLIRF